VYFLYGSATDRRWLWDLPWDHASAPAYHGFDSITRLHKADIYRDDLMIKDIYYRFPEFGLTVENRIKGHAVPAVGPSYPESYTLNLGGISWKSVI
jgi:hypothetical protein